MFSLLWGMYEQYKHKPSYNVLLIGPEGSGKTTLLEGLKVMSKGGQFREPTGVVIPTVGLNVGRAEYGNVQFQFWDLGGSGDLSRLWANYYSETHLVLFVIDGTVLEACNQAINFFEETEELKELPIAIIINKIEDCDGDGGCNLSNLENSCSAADRERISFFYSSGKTGKGLEGIIEWLQSEAKVKD